MKGDFSRGFQPDQKRSKRYRRVLLQQGRVLLDSDHAALVDATDNSLRELASDLGCKAGSPDHGFLITSGKLLRLFDDGLDGIEVLADAAMHRDYGHKYLDRMPSLFMVATGPGSGEITIRLAEQFVGDALVLWIRSEGPVDLSVSDEPITAASGNSSVGTGGFERVVFSFAGTLSTNLLRISISAGARIWLGMIETVEDAGDPGLWVAPGRYYLGGMVLENPSAVSWPEQAFPNGGSFSHTPIADYISNGVSDVVAYVEGWERLITHHHDSGVREEALGGSLDTTVRTELIGQVKLAAVDPSLSLAQLRAGMANPDRGDGTLDIHEAAAIVDPDPCAVPVDDGYTGTDNRLYRFEVHSAGSFADVVLKWSRDNGSELFRILAIDGVEVTVATDSALRDGDLVEVLSDIVELGDVPSYPMPGGDAVIALDGTFTPPARQAGVLAVLVAQEPDSLGRPVFALRQVADPSSPVSLPPTQYEPDQRVILRRWHGLIDGADGATQEIESGIEVTLAGARFDVGDWWNYEARVLTQHDNGAWPSVAHGPERRFAPLALLELPNNTGAPVTVTEWPEDRFSSLCASMADDIGYDGSSVCSTADTVQEAIDELYARSGCCKVVFSTCHPDGVDDQLLIKELIERELPQGGVLCLAKGTYEFGAPLDVATLNITGELVIRGCDGTIITNASSYLGPLLIVTNAASLTLDNLILHSPAGVAIQVEFSASSSLRARHCAFVVDGPGAVAIGDPAASLVPINIAGGLEPMNYPNPPPLPPGGVLLELHDCTMLAELGIRSFVMRRLLIERTAIRASIAALSCHWIGELHLRDSLLGDGLQPGDMPGIATLVATPASALAVAWQPSPAAGGSALLGHVIINAKLENTRLSGNFTLFADEIWDSRLTTCDIYGGSRAVMLNRLCNSAIEDSRVVAYGDAVVINIDARMVSISDSLLVGSGGGGLEMTAVYYGPPMRAEGVQVLGNIVLGAQRGIDVGPDGGGDILFRDVLIADNLVYEIGQPIFPGVRLRRLDTSEGSMVLTGNKVSWRQTSAVFVEGVNIHVNDNHIVHGYNGVAVVINDGVGVIVRGNTIECIEEMIAIEAVNSSDVIIQGNVVKSVSGHDLSALSLNGTGDPELGPRIIGNEFGPGQSQIVNVGRAIVRNNLFRGAVLVKDPMDLVFCDNVIESRVNGGLIQDACIIDGIRQGNYEARAQVNGNRVYGDGTSGALRVLPEIVNGDWEVDFHVQVCHNWSNILVIGYCADSLEDPPWDEGSQYDEFRNASAASRIQVIGNRAQFIGANNYEVNAYSIATLNMADYYNSYIIGNSSNPILAPNVKL